MFAKVILLCMYHLCNLSKKIFTEFCIKWIIHSFSITGIIHEKNPSRIFLLLFFFRCCYSYLVLGQTMRSNCPICNIATKRLIQRRDWARIPLFLPRATEKKNSSEPKERTYEWPHGQSVSRKFRWNILPRIMRERTQIRRGLRTWLGAYVRA